MLTGAAKVNIGTLIKYYLHGANDSAKAWQARTGIPAGSALKHPRICPIALREMAAHPELDQFDLNVEPGKVRFFDPNQVSKESRRKAINILLAGRLLGEKAFAGDASRIKKDPDGKPLPGKANVLHPCKVFFDAESMLGQLEKVAGHPKMKEILESGEPVEMNSGAYTPLRLGAFHMFKDAFEIYRYATDCGDSPATAMGRQWRLVVLPEEYSEQIISEEFVPNRFFGFNSEQVLFMDQLSLPAFRWDEDKQGFEVNPDNSKKKKWNHGAMKMQMAVPGQIYRAGIDANGKSVTRHPVDDREMNHILGEMEDTVSYSIEDMTLIRTGVVADIAMLTMSLAEKIKGFKMLMEIVRQNQKAPQKGGFVAYHRAKDELKMIETTMSGYLVDVTLPKGKIEKELLKIQYLNRNFNHYMDMLGILKKMRSALEAVEDNFYNTLGPDERILGLPLLEQKDDGFYPQPPQGDINLSVPTVFVGKDPLPQIEGLKELVHLPMAINAYFLGSRQEGLQQFVENVRSGKVGAG